MPSTISNSAIAAFSSSPFPLEDPLICSDDTVSRGSTLAVGHTLLRGAVVEYDPVAKNVITPPAAGLANAILAADCDSSGGAAPCVIYIGGIFRYTGLIIDQTNNTIAATLESLRHVGIQIEGVTDVTGMRQPPSGSV